jgi:hypothetical protein
MEELATWCLVPGLLLLLAGGSPLHAEREEGREPTDWPAMITRLRQETYNRPGHARTRQQLATAYNNYGVELTGQEQWALAAQQFQEALRLDEDNRQVQQNFSQVWLRQAHEAYERRDLAGAVEALRQAIVLNPELVDAYVLLGQAEYNRQRLKEAKAAWEKAVALDPSRTEIAAQLSQVTEELPVESAFERLSQSYFDLRYEEHLERPVGFDIRDALITARRQVGSDFAYWPTYKLVVLIYSPEQFRQLREETPEWMGGQFDGKIRVPLPSEQFDQAMVRNILFHEYTHALVHDLAKGRCPVWLNEGLAEYQGRTQASRPLSLLAQAHEAQQLIPWTELSDHISPALSAEEVGLAYEESYAIVASLVNRYGFWRIRKLLQAIAGGQPWEEAVAEGFRRKLPRLEADWRDSLPALLSLAR